MVPIHSIRMYTPFLRATMHFGKVYYIPPIARGPKSPFDGIEKGRLPGYSHLRAKEEPIRALHEKGTKDGKDKGNTSLHDGSGMVLYSGLWRRGCG